ncbi:unnamed protein product [Urochloa humidicola]
MPPLPSSPIALGNGNRSSTKQILGTDMAWRRLHGTPTAVLPPFSGRQGSCEDDDEEAKEKRVILTAGIPAGAVASNDRCVPFVQVSPTRSWRVGLRVLPRGGLDDGILRRGGAPAGCRR